MVEVEISSDKSRVVVSLISLQQFTIRLAFFNLFLVAALGLMLRSYSFIKIPFDYRFLLHAHSHFAFGGWVMPLLTWLIMRYFPEITNRIAIVHWRNITALNFFSAYGMLSSFPFQGYGAISIVFSTLSILGGFYLAIVIWKAIKGMRQAYSIRFLSAGLFYLVLSSIGPFATGPLIAMGQAGTSLYHNAIYFFLHFQYNGYFSFIILAVLVKIMEENNVAGNVHKAFVLFNLACVPAFFLSTLWDHPGVIFYFIGGVAGVLQIAGAFYLLKDYLNLKEKNAFIRILLNLAMAAFIIKLILQLISSIPSIADLAYLYRNVIIAYLHLVLLGFISLSGMAFVLRAEKGLVLSSMKKAILMFLFSFIITEIILGVQPFGKVFQLIMNRSSLFLFSFSSLFPVACLWISFLIRRHFRILKITDK